MSQKPVTRVFIKKATAHSVADADDLLATEDPLEIRIEYREGGKQVRKSISVTMRTPGNDSELACGFLFTEGIIQRADDIETTTDVRENVVLVVLKGHIQPDIKHIERNFYTTSSCGVCGKASIEAVHAACIFPDTKDNLRVTASVLYQLPETLKNSQEVFRHTGGLHGCALFDVVGTLLMMREDVGRHNALDKLIGAALHEDRLPLNDHILLLSGRASFELVQKSAMAGIKIIAAVGAPSSLAVQMADDWGMTLLGFLRGERFNIYSGDERIVI